MMLLGFERRDLRTLDTLFRMFMRDRFLGSALGLVWAVVSPTLMLTTFTFVFGFVFRSKLPGADTSITFIIWLISGYGPWLSISEGLSAGTGSVVGNATMLKNLPFKTELFPLAATLTGTVPLTVSMIFLACLVIAGGSSPSWAWLFLPFSVVVLFVFMAGLTLFLAALNVFIRDVLLVLPNVLLIFLFASPIFYPVSAYPEVARGVVTLNPFYVLTEMFRAPILLGELPPLWQIAYAAVVASLVFVLGLRFFRRLKSHFDSFL